MKIFFITENEAVILIISAATLSKCGVKVVLKMPLIRLEDLFDSMKDTKTQ